MDFSRFFRDLVNEGIFDIIAEILQNEDKKLILIGCDWPSPFSFINYFCFMSVWDFIISFLTFSFNSKSFWWMQDRYPHSIPQSGSKSSALLRCSARRNSTVRPVGIHCYLIHLILCLNMPEHISPGKCDFDAGAFLIKRGFLI